MKVENKKCDDCEYWNHCLNMDSCCCIPTALIEKYYRIKLPEENLKCDKCYNEMINARRNPDQT